MTKRQVRDAPPVVPWEKWYSDEAYTWHQGAHVLLNGPTQSGKTLLARKLAAIREYVIVFGTKPRDPSLDAYLVDGYRRIETWPPPRRFLRPDDEGAVRLILWPKIKSRADLRAYRSVYAACLDDVFVKGRWTLVLDEGLWMAGRQGLNLGLQISDIAFGSASNKVTMVLLVQRPANIPPIAWSSVSDALIFHGGVTRDMRELASLGTVDPKDVQSAIQHLSGHQFLDLPCRGGKSWSVSEVDPNSPRPW